MTFDLQKTTDKQPLEKYFELLDTQFTGNQLGISYRKINTWYQEDLLPFPTETGKWRTFSFLEACWVRFIEEVRKWGLGLKMVKDLKNILLEVPDLQEFLNHEMVKKELKDRYGEDRMETVRNVFKSISYEEYKKQFPATIFGLSALNCLFDRDQIFLLISLNGEVIPFNPSKLHIAEYFEMIETFKQRSHLSIHLNSIIVQLLLIKPKKEDALYSRVLNLQENMMIKMVLEPSVKEFLTLQVKKNNSTTLIILESDPVSQLLQLFFIDQFDELVLFKGNDVLAQINYTESLNG
jgi:DNA-binding transcriptional MerR regulator